MAIRMLMGVGAALVAIVAYLLAWPTPIDPVAWQSPRFDPAAWPASGNFEGLERFQLPENHGPEDIEIDPQGRITVGLHDGSLWRWTHPAAEPSRLANTGGRPLGLHWDGARLLVADGVRGLLAVDDDGRVEELATSCGGRPLVFADDLETAADGTVWFSDASVVYAQPDWRLDILESRPHGRLCTWRPGQTDATEVLRDMHFANGVAVDPEQQFVLLNETSRYRVRKVWIAGPRAGDSEIIIDNLPGFPDGISTGKDGRFWIALASPRNRWVDDASGSPWMRQLMWRLPEFLRPKPERAARALAIDKNGGVLHHLFDPDGERFEVVTSVQEHGEYIYLGSLRDTAWARLKIP